jgi:hypothetical protein
VLENGGDAEFVEELDKYHHIARVNTTLMTSNGF